MDQKPVLVFPYPERFGGTMADDANKTDEKKDDGMQAFGFNMSQKDAQKQVE